VQRSWPGPCPTGRINALDTWPAVSGTGADGRGGSAEGTSRGLQAGAEGMAGKAPRTPGLAPGGDADAVSTAPSTPRSAPGTEGLRPLQPAANGRAQRLRGAS
jgi:hypothetical protein